MHKIISLCLSLEEKQRLKVGQVFFKHRLHMQLFTMLCIYMFFLLKTDH